jgi:hypothetical protein
VQKGKEVGNVKERDANPELVMPAALDQTQQKKDSLPLPNKPMGCL